MRLLPSFLTNAAINIAGALPSLSRAFPTACKITALLQSPAHCAMTTAHFLSVPIMTWVTKTTAVDMALTTLADVCETSDAVYYAAHTVNHLFHFATAVVLSGYPDEQILGYTIKLGLRLAPFAWLILKGRGETKETQSTALSGRTVKPLAGLKKATA
jgi:hypothetical protein